MTPEEALAELQEAMIRGFDKLDARFEAHERRMRENGFPKYPYPDPDAFPILPDLPK